MRPKPDIGDYVLASRWSDGDPKDPWVVGVLMDVKSDSVGYWYKVAYEKDGKPAARSCRRAERISIRRGVLLLGLAPVIETRNASVWRWKNMKIRELEAFER